MLSFIISKEIEANAAVCIVIGILLMLASIGLVIYSIGKLNSKVAVTEEYLMQKQFGKVITISFENIDNVSVSHSPLIKAPPLVTVYHAGDKISFETTSRIYKSFREHCNNDSALVILKNELKKHCIYD